MLCLLEANTVFSLICDLFTIFSEQNGFLVKLNKGDLIYLFKFSSIHTQFFARFIKTTTTERKKHNNLKQQQHKLSTNTH